MRLSNRIYKITEKIDFGETVADIGTDHGYVPMILVKSNKSPHVIMSDISYGSLSKAIETFKLCGIEANEDDFRTGDGLETVESGETDTVIIAGLGGHTIAGILAQDITKSRSFKKLVLQPRKHSGSLRYFLYVNGWDIVDEDLAKEGKFACEIITAIPSSVCNREAPFPEDDIRWKYPVAIVNAEPELAHNRLSWKISSIEEQIKSLEKSDNKTEMIESLKSDLNYLNTLL